MIRSYATATDKPSPNHLYDHAADLLWLHHIQEPLLYPTLLCSVLFCPPPFCTYIIIITFNTYRSAGYIWEYSLYLSTLPIITSATGLTSWMFAVEGSVANMYLLYLAYAFKRDQSNASARKVFLCSLWYLPLLLGAYIFHSKVWNETMHTEDMVSYLNWIIFFHHVWYCYCPVLHSYDVLRPSTSYRLVMGMNGRIKIR